MRDKCDGCFYNRPVYAWGELIPEACWYGETKKNMYGKLDDPSYCSGYEEIEKQLEIEIEELIA